MVQMSESRLSTGQLSYSGGIDSGVVPTIASQLLPNGLRADRLSWGNNLTVRDAGISPRGGWKYRTTLPLLGLFQGGSMYEPDFAYPYLITSIAGRTFLTRVDTDYSTTEITIAGDPNPADAPLASFVQGEQFLIQQAGDLVKLPQWWDGTNMTRSNGFQPSTVVGPSFTVPAVGSVVLANLAAPYTGALNEIIMIGGYSYRQIDPAQRYSFGPPYPTNVMQNPTVPFGTPTGGKFPVSYATGLLLSNTSVPTAPAVVLYGVNTAYSTLTVTEAQKSAASNILLEPTNIVAATQYTLTNYAISDRTVGTVIFHFTPNPFAPTVGNQIYLLNIDDPRTGTVISPVTTPAVAARLPTGGPMAYYMGRIWVANGREYVAGDIVGGTSGTGIYGFRDSILNMTENVFTVGGGAFIVPTNAGNIRSFGIPSNLDTALGEGQLKIGTRRTIYSLTVTPDRASWLALREPLQRVELRNFGFLSDRAVVPVNGDLYYRSIAGVNSLVSAIRYFQQPGNTPISNEESRIINLDQKDLLDYCSAILFDNRLLMTCAPYQTPYGVAHKGVMPLNFDIINSIDSKLPPVWEGVWEGLNILQLFQGDFGGNQRAFAVVYSDLNNALEVWELTRDDEEDEGTLGTDRIVWSAETPSFTWGKEFDLKQLETIELWVDRVFGKVEFKVEYRNDQNPCWIFWHYWSVCAARDNCELESAVTPCDYPYQTYQKQYRATMVLPRPIPQCDDSNARPTDIGYSFQFRISIKGSCRIRGMLAHAHGKSKAPFERMVCGVSGTQLSSGGVCPPGPVGATGPQGDPGDDGVAEVLFGTDEDPNGIVTANPGTFYKDAVSGLLWVKQTGTGNSGWI